MCVLSNLQLGMRIPFLKLCTFTNMSPPTTNHHHQDWKHDLFHYPMHANAIFNNVFSNVLIHFILFYFILHLLFMSTKIQSQKLYCQVMFFFFLMWYCQAVLICSQVICLIAEHFNGFIELQNVIVVVIEFPDNIQLDFPIFR